MKTKKLYVAADFGKLDRDSAIKPEFYDREKAELESCEKLKGFINKELDRLNSDQLREVFYKLLEIPYCNEN